MATNVVDSLKTLGLLLSAATLAVLSTHLLHDRVQPIGWIYLAQFGLAAVYGYLFRGTHRWIVAVWAGATFMLIVGAYKYADYTAAPPYLLAIQYLPAALTGGLLGQWLRYRFALRHHDPIPQLPSAHLLIITAALLLLLPLLAFGLLVSQSLSTPHISHILMFFPANTPFLIPSMISALLCGHWLLKHAEHATPSDILGARILLITAYPLLLVSIGFKLVYGFMVIEGLMMQ